MALSIRSVLIIIVVYAFTGCATRKFTIPILPDTQEAVTRQHEMFYSQLQWLANAKDSLNIPIVLHVGDLVNFDTLSQYEVASKGFKALDSVGLPYAIAVGNHDTEAVLPNSGSAAPGNVNQNLRKTYKFNQYFPSSRFGLLKGQYEAGKSDNSYHTFKAGNKKWMVVVLEFCAREGAAEWMDKVIKMHPKHNVIVLTHYHLNPDGTVATNNAGYGDMKVSDIFDKYIKPNKNVRFVVSGHKCYTAIRTDIGTQGNKIHQILTDFQCKDNGSGYIRLMEIDTRKKTAGLSIYSPFYNKKHEDSTTIVLQNLEIE